MRIDLYLAKQGLASSRERAQELISNGAVLLNGTVCFKNSAPVSDDDRVEVTEALPFVGRGGKKLEHALRYFSLDLHEKTVLDIGASTGGFTDCALQHGATAVYAVDVGHDQLAEKLRYDPRVKNLEGVHVKDLAEHYQGKADFICVDVSFLSLEKVLPFLTPFCHAGTDFVTLVKPQFEIRHKKSVIRDPKIHEAVLRKVVRDVQDLGYVLQGITWSPIRGTEGNIEFLMYLKYGTAASFSCDLRSVVKQAHHALKER